MAAPVKRESDASRALLAWCRAHVDMSTLSREFGLSRSMVSGWAHGYCVPPKEHAARIEERCGIAASAWPQRGAALRDADAAALALDIDVAAVSAFAGEEARPVPFAPGFYVTETGNLIRASKRRGLRRLRTWDGTRKGGKAQRTAILTVKGCPQLAVRTSRLVCLVFNGSPPDDERTLVLHFDDDSSNDHYSNLRWGTAKENTEDCLRNEGFARGLTNARARRAIAMSRDGKTITEIARHFGVTFTTVENLLSGKTWLHLEGDRTINKSLSRQRVAIALAKLGFSSADISILTDVKRKSITEMLSRARRLGHLPRSARAA